jgi:FAD/FMN-containing dehydrogenase
MTSVTELVLDRGYRGEIIEPGHAQYADASRSVFAAGTPAYIFRPRNVGDVQTAVRFAASAGLRLSIRGGGHSLAGFGTNDGGVVIDLRHLAGVKVVHPASGLVRIGGGATWGQVADALAEYGLAISSGDTRSVGVGGLTLSGGIGWKVRKYGLALDSLVGAEVVTAAGEVVHTTAEDHPELFWALRGGGGNFGVVTNFDFVAQPTTDVFHGKITFSSAEPDQVLLGWADYLRCAAEDLTSVVVLANPMNGGRQAPVEIHVTLDDDDPVRAAEVLGPIRRLGTVLDDDVTLRPYADTLAEGAIPPPGLAFVSRSAFVAKDSVPDLLGVVARVSSSDGTPVISVRSLGGAVARVPDDATAYAYRQAELMVVSLSAGPASVVDAARPELDAAWERFAPHVTGAYANFLTESTAADVAAVYPRQTRERLARVKRRYDPDNLFSGNHNIAPLGRMPRR